MTRSVGTTLGKMWRRMIQALERPATTASATKSCSLMASVSPRICRAKRGQSRSAIELGRQGVGGAVLGEGGEREPHVLRGQFAACVVELDALAQVERP